MRSHRSLYLALLALALVGPLLLNLRVQPATAALLTQVPAVDAKIEIVWPHDEQGNPAPVGSAPLVNVEVYLFERGTLNPVSCSFPNRVILYWAGKRETGDVILSPSHGSAVGERISRMVNGVTFSTWVFNDISIDLGRTYFFVQVEGAEVRTNVWAHSADARTIHPLPLYPAAISDATPAAVDALIQVVWPHDQEGNLQPVTEADLVNVGVDLAIHPVPQNQGWTSVGASFDHPVRLLRALNNGFLESVKVADAVTTQVNGPVQWPRWQFNDIDVSAAQDPLNKYFFAVQIEGTEAHTTIWSHGDDPRTYFPQTDVPARSCTVASPSVR